MDQIGNFFIREFLVILRRFLTLSPMNFVLQVMIMALVGTEAHYHYLPSEYVIFGLLLAQGLLEGAAFRTTVFTLHKEVPYSVVFYPILCITILCSLKASIWRSFASRHVIGYLTIILAPRPCS